MRKKIITISRQFGSGGRTVGKELAAALGIAYYDRELIEKVAEKTGYSVDWGWKNGRDHYRYVDVIDHYICIFNVEFFNGETGTIKCKKNDYRYNKLIKKA